MPTASRRLLVPEATSTRGAVEEVSLVAICDSIPPLERLCNIDW